MRKLGIALAAFGVLLTLYFWLLFDVTVSIYGEDLPPNSDPAFQMYRKVSEKRLADRNVGLAVGIACGLAGVFILTRREPSQGA